MSGAAIANGAVMEQQEGPQVRPYAISVLGPYAISVLGPYAISVLAPYAISVLAPYSISVLAPYAISVPGPHMPSQYCVRAYGAALCCVY
eukprot:2213745-Rhodomonas_salina.1